MITGWGYGIHLTAAASLKHLVLRLVPRADCKAEYENSQYTPTVDENMLCTGPTKYGENVCMGDAGGALAVKDPQRGDVVAAGILSYDKSCGQDIYGVYMAVSKYIIIYMEMEASQKYSLFLFFFLNGHGCFEITRIG